jgi:hypothetical protein
MGDFLRRPRRWRLVQRLISLLHLPRGRILQLMKADIEIPEASEAAIRLFACITRFEFALKEAGYVAGEQGGRASPNWNDFEKKALGSGALKRIRAAGNARELLEGPPRKQLRFGNSWQWGDPLPLSDERELCLAIRQVRNNLFHGGKSGPDPRDDSLCLAASNALLELLDVDPDVKNAFLGLY